MGRAPSAIQTRLKNVRAPSEGEIVRHTTGTLVLLALVLGGCLHAPTPPVQRGSVDIAPAFEALPSIPREPGVALSSKMHFALLLAEEALSLRPPRLPDTRDFAHLQTWSDSELAVWLERKSHTVDVARHELDEAAEEAHHQRILAGAVVGLLYEDVARTFESVPVPDDLADEPEIAATFLDIVDFSASPYREHARRAYLACASNSITPEVMRHFGRFCAERAERLPPARSARGQSGVEMSVAYYDP